MRSATISSLQASLLRKRWRRSNGTKRTYLAFFTEHYTSFSTCRRSESAAHLSWFRTRTTKRSESAGDGTNMNRKFLALRSCTPRSHWIDLDCGFFRCAHGGSVRGSRFADEQNMRVLEEGWGNRRTQCRSAGARHDQYLLHPLEIAVRGHGVSTNPGGATASSQGLHAESIADEVCAIQPRGVGAVVHTWLMPGCAMQIQRASRKSDSASVVVGRICIFGLRKSGGTAGGSPSPPRKEG